MRVQFRRGFALLVSLVLIGLTMSTTSAIAVSRVQVLTQPTTFSPNGDGQEDVYSIQFQLDSPGNVSVWLTDNGGSRVATLAEGQSMPQGTHSLTWEGQLDGGLLAGDGTYTAHVTSVDRDAQPIESTVLVAVDTRTPARIVTPTPGSSLNGLVDLVVAPTAGFTVESAWFSLPRCSWTATPEPDGAFAVRQADMTPCGSGELTLQSTMYWRDSFGSQHTYSTSTPVMLLDTTPPVVTPGYNQANQSLYLTSPDVLGSATFNAHGSDSSELTWVWTLNDASGTLLATLPWQKSYYYDPNSTYVTWNGTDAEGALLPDGTYTITATATDGGGLSGSLDYLVSVDRRTPAELLMPTPGASVGAALDVLIRPRDGLPSTNGYLSLGNCWSSTTVNEAGELAWSQFDTSACGSGDQSLTWTVSWMDAQGAWHSYYDSVIVTLVDATAPVVTPGAYTPPAQVIALQDAANRESRWFSARCTDASAVTWTFEALDSANQVVRKLSPYATGCGSWNYDASVNWDGTDDSGSPVPDGNYVVRATATDAGGLSSAVDFAAIVDTRVPAQVTSPSAGLTLGTNADLTLVPGTPQSLTQAYFSLGRCSWSALPQPDGSHTVPAADVSTCGVGEKDLIATAYYNDQFGQGHGYTMVVPVTLVDTAPPVITLDPSYERQVLGLTSPGVLETRGISVKCIDASTVTWTADVQDASGNVVKTLQPWGRTECGTYWYLDDASVYWDGTDQWGTQVPEGAYQLLLTATDAGGLQGSVGATVTVDPRVPGALTMPSAGSILTGRQQFEFASTGDIITEQVDLQLGSIGASIYNASADGVWRTTYPMGGLPAGPTTLHWQQRWRDSGGGVHYFYGAPVDVAIDPTSLSLEASLEPTAGQAPYTSRLTLRASDPNDRTVTLKVDWGDGSGPHEQVIGTPYEPLTLDHEFTSPGTFNVVVIATNGASGFASRTLPVVVEGAPNEPPVLSAGFSGSEGTAPFQLSLSIDATDPNGDPLTYRVDFGDGSPVQSGTLPGAPVTHTFDRSGTFLMRVQVSDGSLTSVEYRRITVGLAEPLRAMAGDDRQAVVGQPLAFDGTGSRPTVGIESLRWAFGDGVTSDLPVTEHTYSAAGTYTATLTVRAGSVESIDEVKVTVTDPPRAEGLTLTITAPTGPVPDATAMVILPDGSRVQATSKADGRAFLAALPDGPLTAYVWAEGFKPAVVEAVIADRVADAVVTLDPGAISAALLESKPLTLEEITNAGVQVEDPTNFHAYEATINLYFEPHQEGTTDTPVEPLRCLIVDQTTSCQSGTADELIWDPQTEVPVNDPSGGGTTEYRAIPKVIYVSGQPILQWLVIPMKASFLKEFFGVTMIVQNLTTGFTFQQGSASLSMPPGLSLAPLAEPQNATRAMQDIQAGSSQTTSWVVRGDVEGEYSLSAEYAGSVEPIGQPVRIVAATQTPLKVWGASALETKIFVDDEIMRDHPYEIDVQFHNVAPTSVYNLQVEFLEQPPNQSTWNIPFVIAPLPGRIQQTAELRAGESWTAHYTIFPAVGNEQTTDVLFELKQWFMQRTGGDVDLAPTIQPRHNPLTGAASGKLGVRVEKNDAGDYAEVSWLRPPVEGVDHYRFFTRQSLSEGDWSFRKVIDKSFVGSIEFEKIMAAERAAGRYYAVATVMTDGSTRFLHGLGMGPAHFVAMGDSYSSGEGIPEFEPDTDVPGDPIALGLDYSNICHRSLNSYSRLLAQEPEFSALLPALFKACSGAITADVVSPNGTNDGEPAQLDHVSAFTDLITLTMGGNDIDFGPVGNDCLGLGFSCTEQLRKASTADYQPSDPSPRETELAYLYNGVLKRRLHDTYTRLAREAPNATIMVLEYPEVIQPGPIGVCNVGTTTNILGIGDLDDGELLGLMGLISKINEVIRSAKDSANQELGGFERIKVVPVRDEFLGHALCEGSQLNPENTSYINPVVHALVGADGNQEDTNFSLHPNALGAQAYQQALAKVVRQWLGVVHPQETVLLGESSVAPGAVAYTARSSWPGSTVRMTLTSPSGALITAATPGVRSGSDPTSEWIEVPNPESGTWRVSVTGVDVAESGEPVRVTASVAAGIPASPTAVATAAPGEDPRTFRLDATASTVGQGAADYRWVFSDGAAASGGAVTHTFTNNGEMWATVQVYDGISAPSFATVSLGVAPQVPEVSAPAVPEAHAGEAYELRLSIAGYPTPMLEVVDGLLPAGLVLGQDGLISGTPTTGGVGTFSVRATNERGTMTVGPLNIVVNAPPVFTSTPPSEATVGGAFEHVFQASGHPAPTFRVSEGVLPDGLVLDQGGVLQGTPTTPGTTTATIEAGNASGVVTQAITLVVSPAPIRDVAPPAVTGTVTPELVDGWANGPVTVTWSATDPEPSAGGVTTPPPTTVVLEGRDQLITSEASCDSAGHCGTGSVTVSIDLTAPTITASVADAAPGSAEKVVHFECSDALSGIASCPADVLIVVGMSEPVRGTTTDKAGNTAADEILVSAPAFTSGALNGATVTGSPYAFTFTATGVPMPTFSVAEGELPPGLALTAGGELTGTPTTAGTYTFVVAATSSTGRAMTGPCSIVVVAATPIALVVNTESLSGGWVGRPYLGPLTAIGGSAPYVWKLKGKLPPGLSLDATSGELTGVPTKAGTYTFAVTVTDSSPTVQRAGRTLSLTISAPDIGVMPATLATAKLGRAYSVTFKASGGTAPYTFVLEGNTSVSGLTLSVGGVLSGTPIERGTFTFTVRVQDADGAVGWRQYNLVVR